MICHAFLATVETTRHLQPTHPKMHYPYTEKRYHPLYWSAQALSIERERVVLPIGRGRQSLLFHGDLPAQIGGGKLVWNDGDEVHVSVPALGAHASPGNAHATVD